MNTNRTTGQVRSPRISIITVVYNGASTLEQTILSVLKQTYSRIEYIIIDGGSKDGTVDIIKKYQDRIAYWVSEPDEGIYDAMNKGIRHASGDWIYFLGADDILYNILHCMTTAFVNDSSIYYGNVQLASSAKLYNGKFNIYKLSTANLCHQAVFYPAKVFQLYKYDLRYPVYADYYLNLQCWADRRLKFQYLPFTVAAFCDNGISAHPDKNKDWRFERDKTSLIRKNLSFCALVYATCVKFAVQLLHIIKGKSRNLS